MDLSTTNAPVFSDEDQRLVTEITGALAVCDNPHADHLEQTIQQSIKRLNHLAEVMQAYPSLLQSQSLGQQKRDNASLIDALSHATLFTVDMLLPVRALVGQTYIMARLNFFRLLHQVVQEALGDCNDFTKLEDAIGVQISRSLHAKVIESLLISMVCDNTVEDAVRSKGAGILTRLWENRFSKRIETYYPVLEATWEARRQTTVQLGTLMGVSEIFALMRAGGDLRFVDYFSRQTCPDEELQAFREFLFGVSTEELEVLDEKMKDGKHPVFTTQDAASTLSLPPTYLYNHSATDFVTNLYLFFVKRHLEAHTRRIRDLAGPKRTAEEYVMVFFLEQACAAEGK